MKHTVLMASVALFIAGAAVPTFADTVGVGAAGQVVTTATVGGTSATLDATADSNTSVNGNSSAPGTDTDASLGSLMAAISADADAAATVQKMNDISSVTVIKVAALAEGNNQEAVKAALATKKSDVANLQAAIAANTKLKAKLEEKSVKPSSVVALNMGAKGAVTVFVE